MNIEPVKSSRLLKFLFQFAYLTASTRTPRKNMFAQMARRVALTQPSRVLSRRMSPSALRSLSTEADGDSESEPKRPTLSEVSMLPRHVSEYSPELLISSALAGDPEAIRERLTREVMRVDRVEWSEANDVVDQIHDANGSGIGLLKLPYKAGVLIGFISAWGCLPLVFDLSTAEAFNEAYVTTEHPQPEDVETWLEVGAWTWNWMEPLLGTIR